MSRVKKVLERYDLKLWFETSYVDDVQHLFPLLAKGTKWDPVVEKLIHCPIQASLDKSSDPRARSDDIYLQIFNSRTDDLTFTVETESDFKDGWIPTLDTQLQLAEVI